MSKSVCYELFCISRAKIPQEFTRNLLRKSALIIMASGGCVRQLENYGESQLAYKMRRNHEWFQQGRHWSMQFHASPDAVLQLQQQLKLDPTVVRHGIKRIS